MTPNENVVTALMQVRRQLEARRLNNQSKRQSIERVLPSHREELQRITTEREQMERTLKLATEECDDFQRFLNEPGKTSHWRQTQLDRMRGDVQETQYKLYELREKERKAQEEFDNDQSCLKCLAQDDKELTEEFEKTDRDIKALS
jgi:chromosome segregation ATPase